MANSDSDRVPFQRFDQWATFMLANMAWIMFALPLITLPLGTVGLFQVMSLWTRGKQPEFFKDFFGAMRDYWWKSLLIGLIDVVVGGLLIANMVILNIMGFENLLVLLLASLTVFISAVLLMVNLYVWSLLVVAGLDLRTILVLSFQLVFAHLLRTLVILIAGVSPVIFAVFLRLPLFVWFLGIISISAYIINKGTWQVIRRYLPDHELLEYEFIDNT